MAERLSRDLGAAVCGGCPAAEFIAAVKGEGVEVPGVRCRIEHNTLSLKRDPRTILRWCAQPAVADDVRNGYVRCPTWQFEKDRLEMGLHSLGDAARMEQADEAQWREDLTGSPHGDLSIFEEAGRAASETVTSWQEDAAARPGR